MANLYIAKDTSSLLKFSTFCFWFTHIWNQCKNTIIFSIQEPWLFWQACWGVSVSWWPLTENAKGKWDNGDLKIHSTKRTRCKGKHRILEHGEHLIISDTCCQSDLSLYIHCSQATWTSSWRQMSSLCLVYKHHTLFFHKSLEWLLDIEPSSPTVCLPGWCHCKTYIRGQENNLQEILVYF